MSCVTLTVSGCISTSTSAQQVFLAGRITIPNDIKALESTIFTCTPAQTLDKGDYVPASGSPDGSWASFTKPLQFGKHQIEYPIIGMVRTPDGLQGVIPGVLKVKVGIKAGEPINSGGYQIETKRAVNAGDSISVFMVGDSILSIEGVEGAKDKSEAKPWFAAYMEGTKPSARASMVEAWWLANKHKGIVEDIAGQFGRAAHWGELETVKRLLKANPDLISSRDDTGWTPLHLAAAGGSKEVVEFLLAQGADVNARTTSGSTPSGIAEANGKFDISALLRRNRGQAKNDTNHEDRIREAPRNWPRYTNELTGLNEVRVKNPNDFKVRVGLRSGRGGKDFIVSSNATESVNVPNGRYLIYFNYSSDPNGLYQGDSFTLENNGVEVTITKVINGNYGIRKVKSRSD